jgi:hypothetical protein
MQIQARVAENKRFAKGQQEAVRDLSFPRQCWWELKSVGLIYLKIKASHFFETSVTIYQSTRCTIPEELDVQKMLLSLECGADLKVHVIVFRLLWMH